MKRYIFVTVISICTLASCIEEVNVPIRYEAGTLVVEGLITTAPPPYRVRLSYTGEFDYGSQIPASLLIKDAKVSISDDAGNSTSLVVLNNDYQTTNLNFRGVVGRSYTLTVELPGGGKYVSKPEKILPVPPIDKVYHEFENIENLYDAKSDPYQPDGYRLYVDLKDPATERNYYRWTATGYSRRATTGEPCPFFCFPPCKCNTSCFVQADNNALNVLSDAQVNGNAVRRRAVYFSPLYTTGNHYVEIAQYSMSREAFQFWLRYQEQSTRTGSIFDPIPAPIEGNIVNAANPNDLALGYFGASAVYRVRYVFNPDTNDPDFIDKLPPPRFNGERVNRDGGCTKVFDTTLGTGIWPIAGWENEKLN
jgi:hypothetical protein